MGAQLKTKVGPLEWPTPLSLASGTCGYGAELDGRIDWSAVGAIFTKGLSLEPRRGHPPPRIWETPSGMLNAIGLENVGLGAFLRDKLSFLHEFRAMHGGRVFVNVFGTSVDEYSRLCERLDASEEIDGFELNLSCPNVKEGGIEFGRSAASCSQVLTAVRRVAKKFVAVKLTPAYPVAEIARACADHGADALSIANTMPAMAIDVEARLPRLAAKGGGLSGPALHPIAVKMTYDARRATSLPIIGIGGVTTWQDAVELFLAGANAVQIGTATFADPNAIGKIRDGLVDYLDRHGEPDVAAVTGALRERA